MSDGARRERPEARELDALDAAVALLATRDRTRHELARRLERRGLSAGASAEAVESLTRAGYVDDGRFAARRAEVLSERGAGDALILDDLARRGVPEPVAAAAVEALEPERARARRVVEARGESTRTLRLLAAKGFAAESLEALVAEIEDGTVG